MRYWFFRFLAWLVLVLGSPFILVGLVTMNYLEWRSDQLGRDICLEDSNLIGRAIILVTVVPLFLIMGLREGMLTQAGKAS